MLHLYVLLILIDNGTAAKNSTDATDNIDGEDSTSDKDSTDASKSPPPHSKNGYALIKYLHMYIYKYNR